MEAFIALKEPPEKECLIIAAKVLSDDRPCDDDAFLDAAHSRLGASDVDNDSRGERHRICRKHRLLMKKPRLES